MSKRSALLVEVFGNVYGNFYGVICTPLESTQAIFRTTKLEGLPANSFRTRKPIRLERYRNLLRYAAAHHSLDFSLDLRFPR